MFHFDPAAPEFIPGQPWLGFQASSEMDKERDAALSRFLPAARYCLSFEQYEQQQQQQAAAAAAAVQKRCFKLDVFQGLAGEAVCSLEADRSWTVADVKVQLSKITGFPPHEQRLLLAHAGDAVAMPLNDSVVVRKATTAQGKKSAVQLRLVRLDPSWAHALNRVKEDGRALASLDDQYREDWEINLEAVRNRAKAMKHVSKEFGRNKYFLLAAVEANAEALKYVSGGLQLSRDFLFDVVQRNGAALKHVSEDLRKDRDLVRMAIQKDHSALKYASSDIRSDRDFILAAVQNDDSRGEPLPEPCTNEQTKAVYGFVEKGGQVLKYAAEELRHDPVFVLDAVERWGAALKYAPDQLRRDPFFVMAASRRNFTALKYAADDLWSDFDFVKQAVQKQGSMLKYASADLQQHEVIKAAAKRNRGINMIAEEG